MFSLLAPHFKPDGSTPHLLFCTFIFPLILFWDHLIHVQKELTPSFTPLSLSSFLSTEIQYSSVWLCDNTFNSLFQMSIFCFQSFAIMYKAAVNFLINFTSVRAYLSDKGPINGFLGLKHKSVGKFDGVTLPIPPRECNN